MYCVSGYKPTTSYHDVGLMVGYKVQLTPCIIYSSLPSYHELSRTIVIQTFDLDSLSLVRTLLALYTLDRRVKATTLSLIRCLKLTVRFHSLEITAAD